MRTTITNRIAVGASDFWSAYLDEETTCRLYTNALGFDRVEAKAERQTDGSCTRELRYAPRLNMPAAVKKVIGDRLQIVERGAFAPTDGGRWTFQVFPSSMTDRITIVGSVVIEPEVGAIRRVTELDIRARIFGIGGVIERFIEKTTRENCQKSADWLNRHFAEQAAPNPKSVSAAAQERDRVEP